MGKERETDDLRIVKTRRILQRAFIELLCEEGFNKISIATLMKRAGYSRSTFYAHYQNVWEMYEDVVRTYVDELCSGYEVEQCSDMSLDEQTFRIVYEIVKKVKEWYPLGRALLDKRLVPDILPELVEAYAWKKAEEGSSLFPTAILDYIDPGDAVAREMGMRFSVITTIAMFECAARHVTPKTTKQEMVALAESMHAGNAAFDKYAGQMTLSPIKWEGEL